MTFQIIIAFIVYIAMIFSVKYRTAITSIGLGIILLILVAILFTNKQYNDSRKKETYRKSNIYI